MTTVSIDNISGARNATEYLIDSGHERISCIVGPLNSVLNLNRLKGFYQAIKQQPYRESCVSPGR
ncbi:hypothetical protein EM808_12355 [Niallia taxi]|uniref:Ribose operon repressor n=1 Tax=Niallia taxi TaxID=2499688 RepID=A0A437KBL2_9BACI|nr:hypothetical protein EM808_12355 [Niallia taxi]